MVSMMVLAGLDAIETIWDCNILGNGRAAIRNLGRGRSKQRPYGGSSKAFREPGYVSP
jgi:hypothetical protein